jgi:hypothetical protein
MPATIMTPLTLLPPEVIENIFNFLESSDLLNCSLACKLLYQVFSIQQYGFIKPRWHNLPCHIPNNGIAELKLYYRNAVLIGATLYIVILSLENPTCWKLDLNGASPKWVSTCIKVCDSYRPVKYPATSSILNKIYIHGGVDLFTGQATNILYEFDVNNMQLLVLTQYGMLLYPCSMHVLSAIDCNRLALYGGQCVAEGNVDSVIRFRIFLLFLAIN